MAIDFVANEGDCWIAAGNIPNDNTGTELRIRTGATFANSGFDAVSRILTSRTAGEVSMRLRNSSTWAINTTPYYWTASTLVDVVRMRATAAGQLQLQYWNGSTWVGVGVQQSVPTISIHKFRLVYSGLGTSSGALSATMTDAASGTIIATWAATGLPLTACPNIARAGINKTTSGQHTISEYIMGNENLDAVLSYSGVGTSTGTDNTGVVGTFAAIDEGTSVNLSVDDADFLQLPTAGSRYSMKMPVRDFAGRVPRTVSINYRARRGASGPTTVRPYLKIGSTRYYAADQVLTTSFVSGYQAMFDIDPSTSATWQSADAGNADLEFGWEAAA